jgi:hypothetical protein
MKRIPTHRSIDAGFDLPWTRDSRLDENLLHREADS